MAMFTVIVVEEGKEDAPAVTMITSADHPLIALRTVADILVDPEI